MSPLSRRDFLKTSLAAGTFANAGALPLYASRRTATDIVSLGKSGVGVTRLAFGTGTHNGQVQLLLVKRNSHGWSTMPMITASAFSRLRNPMSLLPCSARLSKVFLAIVTNS